MEININEAIEELLLSTKTNENLHRLGIRTIDEMLNYTYYGLEALGGFEEESLDELHHFYWNLARRNIVAIDPEQERRKATRVKNNERYFRHVDGIRYEDVPLNLVVKSRHLYLELYRVGLFWYSQVINHTVKMYRECLDLDIIDIWDIKSCVASWELVMAPGVAAAAPHSGEHLFYQALEYFQGFEYYDPEYNNELMAICNEYYQSQPEGYDVAQCLDDQGFGEALVENENISYTLSYYLSLQIDRKYGSTFKEIGANLPKMLQSAKAIRAGLDREIEAKLVSEIVPGYYAKGRMEFEPHAPANYYRPLADKEMFFRMLDNEKPIEIAAAMNLERTQVYRDLRNYFREFDDYRRYAIDVYQDIFDRYEISQEQWEEILGGNRQYNYLRLRHHYATKDKMKVKNPLALLEDDPAIPESLKAQFLTV